MDAEETSRGTMIKCKLCKRITEKKKPTGLFITYVYKNPERKEEGKRIYSAKKVCMNCHGSCLLK